MTLAIAVVKNEYDVIGWVLSHLLNEGIDRIVVADNMSTDGTFELLTKCATIHPDLTVVRDVEPGHFHGDKMTALANAYAAPGEWVVPFDADELWHGVDGTLADVLADAEDADLLTATPFVHVPTIHDDTTNANPLTRMTWRMDTPEPFPKVCVRWTPTTTIHMGNHGADGYTEPRHGRIGVRHFQYRTLAQVKRKVTQGTRAVEAAHLAASTCAHWRNLAAMSPAELHRWWAAYLHQPGLVLDPAPFALCPR